MRRASGRPLPLLALVVALAGLAASAWAAGGAARAPDHPGRKGSPEVAKASPGVEGPKGKLVFVATTGVEDLQRMTASLKHATVARGSGFLEEVAWLSYGRGVHALAGSMSARPEATAAAARQARAAGVRLYVCRTALEGMGIPEATLDPAPTEVVPQGVVKLAELVSQGYQVIHY